MGGSALPILSLGHVIYPRELWLMILRYDRRRPLTASNTGYFVVEAAMLVLNVAAFL